MFKSLFLLLFLFIAMNAQANAGVGLIRDSEIESTLRDFATPIFNTAGLHPDNIRIFIVNDPAINAFVAGGQNIFFNTGLLLKSKRADEVMGVMAHEVGHISGGHLARTQDQLSKLNAPQILTYVLGTTTALLLGNPEVGFAILTGGSQIAMQNILQYTRTQERSADAAAVTFLNRLQMSPSGLYDFMKMLSISEQWREKGNPYMMTHPSDKERLNFLQDAVTQSPYKNQRSTARDDEKMAFIRGKLLGFLQSDSDLTTFLNSKESNDTALDHQYTKAIALYREHQAVAGRALMIELIKKYPWYPYIYDTMGQLEAMHGDQIASLNAYKSAYNALPFDPLIRLSLGNQLNEQAKKETDTQKKRDYYEQAETHLLFATQKEPFNALAWRFLSVSQAGLGKTGMAELSLAEIALLNNNADRAEIHIQRAAMSIKQNDDGWIKIQDLRQAQKDLKRKKTR